MAINPPTNETQSPYKFDSGITVSSAGATAATRYIGGTTSGPPNATTVAFSVGDYVVDQTGKIWICTTAGAPGTWTAAGSGLTAGGVLSGTYPNPGFAAAPSFTGTLTSAGSVDISVAGQGLKIATGSNAKMGSGTLSSGTVSVVNSSVTSSFHVFLTDTSASGFGALAVSALSAGTGFTVVSSVGATDNSTFNYLIVEPG
jgi:hypothetical protein